jgi:Domain of unknown function (DUF6883)
VRLPNPELAVVDLAKIQDYCLNPGHPFGRHKARVFASVLGITREQAGFLRNALLKAAVEEEAILGVGDAYGRRYVLDFLLGGPLGKAKVRSSWIVRTGESFPRLTSCYVL